ncbi:hypothetical protein E5673_01220 [Sphingomonas sp. PAMC26645]|uniref:hypothetical protein n=1 Tax=Sphingomonas sp. PAMC26645 TaxID=2565555 RepID=UPI00109DAC55|nr:hypothetical protein [Sphingomonas sp. PAMC26645]QCB41016.1 hypothetical protein E5673_01220 [Sphingomonas sp. PAMC26645]
MKIIGILLLAGIVLNVLQAALSVLLVVGLIGLIVGILLRPAETFGLLAFGMLASLLKTHPVGCIWIGSLTLIMMMLKRDRSVITRPPVRVQISQQTNVAVLPAVGGGGGNPSQG